MKIATVGKGDHYRRYSSWMTGWWWWWWFNQHARTNFSLI